MKVSEVMTRDSLAACTANATLNVAAHALWVADCGCLPVLSDDAERRLVGVITDRDICMGAFTKGRRLEEISVHEVMTGPAIHCGPEQDLGEAVKAMQQHELRRLPVLDDRQRVVGMLSLADLARHWNRNPRGRDVTATTVARALAEVSASRHETDDAPTTTPARTPRTRKTAAKAAKAAKAGPAGTRATTKARSNKPAPKAAGSSEKEAGATNSASADEKASPARKRRAASSSKARRSPRSSG